MTDDTAAATPTTSAFAALGLDPRLLDTLGTLGYEIATPIQTEAIPPIMAGSDLVGLAATGTGKTAAFTLPLLHRMAQETEKPRGISILILVPTRELCMQVCQAIEKYGKNLGTRTLPVYGGSSYDTQIRQLRKGVDVVVATPGRALDLLRRENLDLRQIKAVVLDEADEMLDMGFTDDIEALLNATPKSRQTLLFSATMPPRIAGIAERHLRNPVRVEIARTVNLPTDVPQVRQTVYMVNRQHKPAALSRLLEFEEPTSAIIFCRTRSEADELTDRLNGQGYLPQALHGGLTQEQRDRVMKKFRHGKANLLIATDIAARGLDIDHLSHVINYDVPIAAEAYIHRIGRVGRAGREGVAITLADPRERHGLRSIENLIKQRLIPAQLPSVADVRQRRLDGVKDRLRASIESDDFDVYRPLVAELSAEFGPERVALAALKMAREHGERELIDEPIPVPVPEQRRTRMEERPAPNRRPGFGRGTAPGMTKLFFGAGRESSVTARDLVGAIANEAGLNGKDIGSIDVAERHSVVEVPQDMAEYIIEAMQGSRIKGRKVNVRLDRGAGGALTRRWCYNHPEKPTTGRQCHDRDSDG